MRDFIFINGPLAVGKNTLAQRLLEHYRSVCIDGGRLPPCGSLDGVTPLTDAMEEQIAWSAMVAMLHSYQSMRVRNILCVLADDLRSREIPKLFRGRDYIQLRLVCSDPLQLLDQMLHRGDGPVDINMQAEMSARLRARPPLVNECVVDVAGKTPEHVAAEAIDRIEQAKTRRDYTLSRPPREQFYSRIWSNGLRSV